MNNSLLYHLLIKINSINFASIKFWNTEKEEKISLFY